MVIVELSPNEAALILYLRKYPHGKFQVTILAGQPVRAEGQVSTLLRAEDGKKAGQIVNASE